MKQTGEKFKICVAAAKCCLDAHLKASHNATAVHPWCNIDSVAPYIILGLLRTHHSCYYWSMVQTWNTLKLNHSLNPFQIPT